MNLPSRIDPIHPAARKGIQLFNQGDYHGAHELLELAWMETQSPERDLYQGVLQIGLAYYQITRANYRGALKMFKRGQRNLAPLGEMMLGVQITQLRADARLAENELRRLGAENIQNFDQNQIQPVPLIK